MTDANAGLGGAFDSYSVQGKVFINLSLWVLRVCVCVCVCVCVRWKGLKDISAENRLFQ